LFSTFPFRIPFAFPSTETIDILQLQVSTGEAKKFYQNLTNPTHSYTGHIHLLSLDEQEKSNYFEKEMNTIYFGLEQQNNLRLVVSNLNVSRDGFR
jgi:hypothetical protein